MESFLRLFCSKFQLNDQEGLEVKISDMATERLRCSKFFLVGKVLSRKVPRANIMTGAKAMAIRDNHILFYFNMEVEVQCVLRGNPWYFSKTLLILAEVKGLDVPVDSTLQKQVFWVCVYGPSSAFMPK
ncbi:hypothetical protein PS2_040193 [Malus domestica]